jgi:endonuclease/exonuclease/phosphatase family metal-dependent hydrolase
MSLRLAIWNCHHGELRTRAALLDGLRPDIVALQECSVPALDAYATAIRSAPTVLLGDFNSNTLWDGDESRPTIYWQRKRGQPYHVDDCFVPERWVARIDDVAVGGWDDLAAESDHRALVVAAQDRTSS